MYVVSWAPTLCRPQPIPEVLKGKALFPMAASSVAVERSGSGPG